jgi:hypothetical protein
MRTTRRDWPRRAKRGGPGWVLEGLEGRVLLSGRSTIYTVNSASGGSSGSGHADTLTYVVGLADANTNPAGSLIEVGHPELSVRR